MTEARDYSATLFLPQTDFPMRAGLPQKEPEILARWAKLGMYDRLRDAARGRTKFVLHDGPPYANGNIHIGTALNKILKDVVTRSQQMLGYDSNYVPGWDCHGLPIEWKIEEEYRAKGKNKDAVPINEFRAECRAFAEHWLGVQREEFKRLGVEGDWENPYTTMSFAAEAQIARELMKFAANGTLYRGSKPVMWSVVEKTALAEAEVEYEDYTSRHGVGEVSGWRSRSATTGAFKALEKAYRGTRRSSSGRRPRGRSPATARSAIRRRSPMASIRRDRCAEPTIGRRPANLLILADKLAAEVFKQARVTAFEKAARGAGRGSWLQAWRSASACKGFAGGYEFVVPLLAGDHVTDDAGTGFVHTAPGHGREDFEIWTANARELERARHQHRDPLHGRRKRRVHRSRAGLHRQARHHRQGREGRRQRGVVIKALTDDGMLIARGRLKHQYPHSWRSKKPVIFRNTPQWFIAMDRDILGDNGNLKPGDTLRHRALDRDRRNQMGPAAGREPHQRHDREPARLGDLAPARLGRADRGVRQATTATARSRSCRTRRSTSASARPSRPKARTPGTRRARASASSAASPTRTGRRSTTFSMSGSTQARRTPSRWRTRAISRASPASAAARTAAATP